MMAEVSDDVNLNALLKAEIAGDLRADGRAHTRYMQVMDRVYLSEFTEQTGSFGEKTGQMNTGSFMPVPQSMWGAAK